VPAACFYRSITNSPSRPSWSIKPIPAASGQPRERRSPGPGGGFVGRLVVVLAQLPCRAHAEWRRPDQQGSETASQIEYRRPGISDLRQYAARPGIPASASAEPSSPLPPGRSLEVPRGVLVNAVIRMCGMTFGGTRAEVCSRTAGLPQGPIGSWAAGCRAGEGGSACSHTPAARRETALGA
jgi:hypothetical protein